MVFVEAGIVLTDDLFSFFRVRIIVVFSVIEIIFFLFNFAQLGFVSLRGLSVLIPLG
jgi:hypothetical protein